MLFIVLKALIDEEEQINITTHVRILCNLS